MTAILNAVVTGAAGGLGEVFARHMVRLGHRVVVTDRQACVPLFDDMAEAIVDMPCDLADPAAVSRFAAIVLERVGPISVLVNNAAIIPVRPFDALDAATFAQVMQVNVTAAFQLAQAFAPAMKAARWGRIVNLSSSTVWGPPKNMAAYATSKMGVIGLTRALAAEFGDFGITVNAISPGLTHHAGSAAALPAAAFDAVRARQFVPRTLEPEDLLGVLSMLVADGSSMVTGQVMNVDGGGFGF